MDISEEKITAKLTELNTGLNPAEWVAIEEQSSLMKTELKDGNVVFNLRSALITKVFMNLKTGELKLYPLSIFKEN